MNKKHRRNLEVLSRIDEEIVEWSSKKRAELMSRRRKAAKKKWYIAGGSIAAALLLVLGTVLLLVNLLAKQVPVYTGMTVSNVNPITTATAAADDFLADNGNGDNGLHKGHYKGDYKQDYGDLSDAFEKPIESTLTVLGGGEERYYARSGEDVYITIHIDNPDSFEILSFTLNGEKYSSYMFEKGSDMENLILKVNVGAVEGVVDYTIDAIKYVDGSEIKDVRMEGDQTVEIGVYTDKQPTAALSGEVIGYNEIAFTVSTADLLGLVADSTGKLEAVLYDGDTILSRQEIATVGQSTVSFTGLKTNTVYQYAVVAHYDALDGKGYGPYVLAERTFYTKAVVLFDGIALSTTGISFALDWDEAYTADRVLNTLEVYQNGVKIADLGADATAVSDLLPDTAYTLVAAYRNGTATERISLEFTTDPLTYTVNHYLAELDGSYGTPVFTQTNAVALNATYTAAPADYAGFVTPAMQSDTATLAGELVLNYYYPRAVFDITFVYNDGSTDRQSLKFGEALPHPIRQDYEFGAWFTDEACTEHVSNVPARNVTVYAQWVNETVVSAFSYLSENGEITVTGLHDNELTSLVIPAYIGGKPVTIVHNSAFAGQAQLLSVTLPNTLRKLGQKAFEGCTALTRVDYTGTLSQWVSIVFDAADSNPLSHAGALYLGNVNVTAGSLVIPSDVTAIGAYAFLGCTGITALTIPADVTSIGAYAFLGCTGITALTIPADVTSIGAAAFEGCTALTSIAFNATAMNALAADTFSAAGAAGEGIAVAFGANVTRVPERLFAHYGAEGKSSPKLKSISFAAGSACAYINQGAFAGCVTLNSVTLPDGLKRINVDAFYHNAALTSVSIPTSVSFIGGSAFAGCALLETVIFGSTQANDIEIGQNAFNNCTKLQSVSLPHGTRWIRAKAFQGCTSLATVSLPQTVQEIGEAAFRGCTSLAAIRIPNPGTTLTLGDATFQGCTALKTVEILANMSTLSMNSFNGCTDLITVTMTGSIGAIGTQAFFGCTKLSSVTLPAGLTRIRDGAFQNCTALASIDLPESLTQLDKGAFQGAGLTSIRIPNSGTTLTLGDATFQGCTALKTVEILANMSTLSMNSFNGCTDLITVTMTGSINAIGTQAFFGCTKLSSVTLPAGLTRIRDGAFQNCTALESIDLPESLTQLDKGAFQGAGLTAIVIPAGVNSVSSHIFYGCKSLTSVVFKGDEIQGTGGYVFYGCEKLESIKLPSRMTGIFYAYFTNCVSLESIFIPASVARVSGEAFRGCTSLTRVDYAGTLSQWTSIVFNAADSNPLSCGAALYIDGVNVTEGALIIPDGVTAIGTYAFIGCSRITDVFFGGTAEEWESVTVGVGNDAITNATVWYYSASKPTAEGNYWYYKGDVATKW